MIEQTIRHTIRLPFAAADPFILPAADGAVLSLRHQRGRQRLPRACVGRPAQLAGLRHRAGRRPRALGRGGVSGRPNVMRSTENTTCSTALTGRKTRPARWKISASASPWPTRPRARLRTFPTGRSLTPVTRSSTPTSTGRTAAATFTIPAAATSTVSANGRKAGSTVWSSSRTFPP